MSASRAFAAGGRRGSRNLFVILTEFALLCNDDISPGYLDRAILRPTDRPSSSALLEGLLAVAADHRQTGLAPHVRRATGAGVLDLVAVPGLFPPALFRLFARPWQQKVRGHRREGLGEPTARRDVVRDRLPDARAARGSRRAGCQPHLVHLLGPLGVVIAGPAGAPKLLLP